MNQALVTGKSMAQLYEQAQQRITALEDALYDCSVESGADMSDRPKDWPGWRAEIAGEAVRNVRQLRADYDEAAGLET